VDVAQGGQDPSRCFETDVRPGKEVQRPLEEGERLFVASGVLSLISLFAELRDLRVDCCVEFFSQDRSSGWTGSERSNTRGRSTPPQQVKVARARGRMGERPRILTGKRLEVPRNPGLDRRA
jgi:hypothetical protein